MTKADALHLIRLINTTDDPHVRARAREVFYQHWTLDDYARWFQEAMGGDPRQRTPPRVDKRLTPAEQQRENALRLWRRWKRSGEKRDLRAFSTYVFNRIHDGGVRWGILAEITRRDV